MHKEKLIEEWAKSSSLSKSEIQGVLEIHIGQVAEILNLRHPHKIDKDKISITKVDESGNNIKFKILYENGSITSKLALNLKKHKNKWIIDNVE